MAQARQLWIGVDGGGTKTALCVLEGTNEHPIATHVAESTNHNSVGLEKAKSELQNSLTEVLKKASGTASDVRGVSLGMAGVDRPADKDRVKLWVHEVLPGVPVQIGNDAVIALASGTKGKLFGVVVISGTGTISVGFDEAGETARAAGWGPMLGDEGSGYGIASDILKACVYAADGRGAHTSLLPAVLAKLGLDKSEDLIAWTYADTVWARIAALAPLVFDEVKKGDTGMRDEKPTIVVADCRSLVAKAILEKAANSLHTSIAAVVRRLNLTEKEFPLVLAGGLLTHEHSPLAEQLKEKIKQSFPKCSIVLPSVDAHIAAALLARNAAQIK